MAARAARSREHWERDEVVRPVGALEAALESVIREALHEEVVATLRAELPDALKAALNGTAQASRAAVADELYLSPQRAAEIVGVTAASIRSWVEHGQIKGYRAGRLTRARLDELRAYLARPPERPEPVDIEARAREILRSTRKATAP